MLLYGSTKCIFVLDYDFIWPLEIVFFFFFLSSVDNIKVKVTSMTHTLHNHYLPRMHANDQYNTPDRKIHGANMGPIWAVRTQVGPMLATELCYLGRVPAFSCKWYECKCCAPMFSSRHKFILRIYFNTVTANIVYICYLTHILCMYE